MATVCRVAEPGGHRRGRLRSSTVIRLFALAVVNLISNAVALVVAATILDDMSLSVSGFFLAVVIFAVAETVVEALVRQAAFRSAPALLGSSALIATLIGLIVTVIISDGLEISGAITWVLATIIVWLIDLLGRFLLPFIIFRHVLQERRERRG